MANQWGKGISQNWGSESTQGSQPNQVHFQAKNKKPGILHLVREGVHDWTIIRVSEKENKKGKGIEGLKLTALHFLIYYSHWFLFFTIFTIRSSLAFLVQFNLIKTKVIQSNSHNTFLLI